MVQPLLGYFHKDLALHPLIMVALQSLAVRLQLSLHG
jgi:hypothetical protein